MKRTLIAAAVVALVVTGAAFAATAHITKSRVGRIHLGQRWGPLHAAGLLGRQRKGCELAGPGTRAAKLRAPLRGIANLTRTDPRRVHDITVEAGATARGVGIGDRIADIRAAYSKVKVSHAQDATLGVTLVRIPKSAGGRIMFAVDATSKKIVSIGIPFIAFCE